MGQVSDPTKFTGQLESERFRPLPKVARHIEDCFAFTASPAYRHRCGVQLQVLHIGLIGKITFPERFLTFTNLFHRLRR